TEGRARILEVTKIKDNLFSHRVKVEKGVINKEDHAELIVDLEKRRGVSRNHTATHLLHYALRKVLGDHVKQSGSMVEQDRLRFDFTHFEGMNDVEVVKVEDIVNEKIMACIDIDTEERSREEAIREGATALFEEKYGEKVRVIRIGDFSMELCGGTHVKNTGEIGSFYIISEGSLASGIRRIEAVTGRAAILYKRKMEKTLKAIAGLSNTEVERVREKVESIVSDLEKRGKEVERLKEEIVSHRVEEALQEVFEKDGTKVVSLFVPNAGAEELRKVTDIIRGKVKSCIAIVGSQEEDKGLIVLAVTKDLQGVYNAGKIVKRISERYGGKGGGGPQIAQGGISGRKVKEALKDLEVIFGS
ncbi:MAG: DHHA1 domain-containing protein, partial [Syntrophorhabdaceae bacterium]|nr:DHHA1 domain-containing protein [Syntrophorhabdaceae bacterium]